MEEWDAYKEDGSLAGFNLYRDEPVPAGLYHLVCEVLVKHTDGSYLLMQRDFKKKDYPGMFEATAGGSALKGETPVVAALRELKEETGIEADELIQIYHILSHDVIYYGFLCITDCEKSSIILQQGETISHIWLPEKDFLRFINTNEYIQAHKDRLAPYLRTIN